MKKIKPIEQISEELGISPNNLEVYGKFKSSKDKVKFIKAIMNIGSKEKFRILKKYVDSLEQFSSGS